MTTSATNKSPSHSSKQRTLYLKTKILVESHKSTHWPRSATKTLPRKTCCASKTISVNRSVRQSEWRLRMIGETNSHLRFTNSLCRLAKCLAIISLLCSSWEADDTTWFRKVIHLRTMRRHLQLAYRKTNSLWVSHMESQEHQRWVALVDQLYTRTSACTEKAAKERIH